jgi:hypothetical protein
MPFDSEQIRYMRKHNLKPEDAIDFPVSPGWRAFYAEHDLMPPAPVETAAKNGDEIEQLKRRLEFLEDRRVNIRTIIERPTIKTRAEGY